MSQRSGKPTAGVTLVELMISLAIMAVAILGVMSVIIHTVKTKEKMREFDIAKQAATSKLEQLRALPWTTTTLATGTVPGLSDTTSTAYANWTVPELAHTTTADQRAFGSVRVYNNGTADFNPNLLDLEVTIFWVGVGGPNSYSARSMYTR